MKTSTTTATKAKYTTGTASQRGHRMRFIASTTGLRSRATIAEIRKTKTA